MATIVSVEKDGLHIKITYSDGTVVQKSIVYADTVLSVPPDGYLEIESIYINNAANTITINYNGGTATMSLTAGAGDMLIATYDPTAVSGDAFDVDNHVSGTTNKVYTATEQTKLDGVATGADVTADNAPQAHKDSHDPNDGIDKLDSANAAEIAAVQAAGTGTSHSFARADHAHQIQAAITDDHLLTVDDASAADNDFARFTASGIEGLTVAEAIAALVAAGFTLPDAKYVTFTDPSVSHTYSGFVKNCEAHEDMVFGDVCFVNTDEEMAKAKGDAIATMPAVCMAVATIDQSEEPTGLFLFWGFVHDDTFAFAHTGGAANKVYVSAATAGLASTTRPSGSVNVVQPIGDALATDQLFFHPDNTYLELVA